MDIAARQAALALLPDAPAPLQIDAGPDEGAKKKTEVIVTPEEESRILAAAQVHTKRTGVCAAAFGGATTGEEYTKMNAVLDRHRLLVPGGGEARALDRG